MNRRWKIVLSTAAILLVVSGSALAATPGLKIFINNNEVNGSYFHLKMDQGTATVSLRSIVEELRGKVTYKNNSFYVSLPDATNATNISIQVNRLEEALLAETPEEAVQTWIRGVQKRSGAMQYAVLSPSLREKTKGEFIEYYWGTGGSSPHMGKVAQLNVKEVTPDQVQITFDYPLVVMNETIDTGSARITVDKIKRDSSDYWAISAIALKDPGDTGLMIGATILEK